MISKKNIEKPRFINSPFQDDKLTPEIPRYYINQIFTSIVLFFLLFSIFSVSFFFNNNFTAIPKTIWYLYTKNTEALSYLTQSIFGINDISVLMKSLFFSLAIPLVISLLIVKLITTPITRRTYRSGRTLNEKGTSVNNYKNFVLETSGFPKNGGISLVKANDLCAITEKPLNEDLLFSVADQEKGLLIVGDAGSGKGVTNNHYYKDIELSKDDIGIVHNVKGDELDFISKFSQVYNIAVTSLNGEEIHAVDFLSFIKDENINNEIQNIYTFIDAFLPAGSSKNDFFILGAIETTRAVIQEALVSNVTPATFLITIYNLFSKEGQQQIDDLNSYLLAHNAAAAGYIDANNPKATMSVIASCIKIINQFKILASFWEKAKHIDIKDKFIFNKQPRRFLILTNNSNQANVCNSYISAIINLLSRFLISPNYTNPFKRRIYFIIDEFPQLTSIDIQTFLKLPDVGRSKGIRCIVSLQRVAQIKENFKSDPLNFYSAFHNKILGRMTEADFEILKGTVGKTTVEDSVIKKTMQKDGSFTSVFEKNVHDIEALKPNELSLTCGPYVRKGKFHGAKMYYFIQGYEEIFSFIRTPVDVSDLIQEFNIKKAKAEAKAKTKRDKAKAAKALEAPTAQNLVQEVPALANAQETSPSPAPAVPEPVDVVSQVDSQEADHLQEEINQEPSTTNEVSDFEAMLDLMDSKE